jgi:Zn-dependent protease with chaperone function
MNEARILVMAFTILCTWSLNIGIVFVVILVGMEVVLPGSSHIAIGSSTPLLTFIATLSCSLFIIHLLLSQLYPVKAMFNVLMPGFVEPLPKSMTLIEERVDGMCKILGVKHVPRIWLIHTDQANAFAVRKLFSRHGDIAITTGLIKGLNNPDQLIWVIGHELGHLVRGDCVSMGFWLAANQTLVDIKRIRDWIVLGTFKYTQHIHFLGTVHYVIGTMYQGLTLVMDLGERIARRAFLLVDRKFNRESEHAADIVASDLFGYTLGVNTLSRFNVGIEPDMVTLFGTHPPISKRVDILQVLSKENAHSLLSTRA